MDDIKAPQMQPEMAGPAPEMPDDNKPEETPEQQQPSAPLPESGDKPKSGKKKKLLIALLVLLLAAGGAAAYYFLVMNKDEETEPATTAQVEEEAEAKTVVAFIRAGNLWVEVDGEEKQVTNDAKAELLDTTFVPSLDSLIYYSNPQVSPDGTKVSYTRNERNKSSTTVSLQIAYVDIETGKSTTVLDSKQKTAAFARWVDDNTLVYIDGSEKFAVSTYDLETAKATAQGSLTVKGGCGGAFSDAADVHTYTDMGFNSFQVLNNDIKSDILYHQGDCASGGIYAFDMITGKDKPVAATASMGWVSPDGKTVATRKTAYKANGDIASTKLLLIGTADGKTVASADTEATAESMAWSPDGKTVFFTTTSEQKALKVDEDGNDSTTANSYKVNKTTLWKLDVDTSKIEKVIDLDIHGLGIKAVVEGEDGGLRVIGGAVENADELAEFFKDGGKIADSKEHLPQVNLMEIDVDKQAWEIIINNAEQADYQVVE